MAILTRYRVEGKASARYVTKSVAGDFYRWCEQSAEDPRYDVAQGTCVAEDLPEHIRARCDACRGSFYATEWPFDPPPCQ